MDNLGRYGNGDPAVDVAMRAFAKRNKAVKVRGSMLFAFLTAQVERPAAKLAAKAVLKRSEYPV